MGIIELLDVEVKLSETKDFQLSIFDEAAERSVHSIKKG